ncbi:7631_t:CDS:2, partial [Racocetra persica]
IISPTRPNHHVEVQPNSPNDGKFRGIDELLSQVLRLLKQRHITSSFSGTSRS